MGVVPRPARVHNSFCPSFRLTKRRSSLRLLRRSSNGEYCRKWANGARKVAVVGGAEPKGARGSANASATGARPSSHSHHQRTTGCDPVPFLNPCLFGENDVQVHGKECSPVSCGPLPFMAIGVPVAHCHHHDISADGLATNVSRRSLPLPKDCQSPTQPNPERR